MRSRAERKANLMAIAEVEIEQMLDWMEATDAPDLGGIEAEVLHIRKRIGEGMTKEVIENQESLRPVPSPSCPKCEQEMHYKGMKGKEIRSMVGEVKLNRGYYYCDHCQSGLFPPGQAVGCQGKKLVREYHTGGGMGKWQIGQL